VRNAKDNLGRAEEILSGLNARRSDLRAEHAQAEEAGYEAAMGFPPATDGQEAGGVEPRMTSAEFSATWGSDCGSPAGAATTPSDQTRVFNGAGD
jgi:hypothetical protein